jgi:hypothetical protein
VQFGRRTSPVSSWRAPIPPMTTRHWRDGPQLPSDTPRGPSPLHTICQEERADRRWLATVQSRLAGASNDCNMLPVAVGGPERAGDEMFPRAKSAIALRRMRLENAPFYSWPMETFFQRRAPVHQLTARKVCEYLAKRTSIVCSLEQIAVGSLAVRLATQYFLG